MCQLWFRLGYTLSLTKSQLMPFTTLYFLGMLCDTIRGAFLLPVNKKQKFTVLRESILAQSRIGLKTLQRFQGKCISFMMAVPGARLYVSEVAAAITRATKNSRPVPLAGCLRQEIEFWRFLTPGRDICHGTKRDIYRSIWLQTLQSSAGVLLFLLTVCPRSPPSRWVITGQLMMPGQST